MWEETRKVEKTGCAKLNGLLFDVCPDFVGKHVDLRFDPFDMDEVEVWFNGSKVCQATRPHQGTATICDRQHKSDPLAVVMLFTGCVSGGFGSFLDVKVDHDRVATVNGFADIAITAENAVRFQFTTYSGGGRIIERHDNRAIWQAPGEPGSYIIDALVTTPAQSTLIRMNIKVVKFPVSVVEAELRDDGLGGKSVRLQALNMADQKVTDFRVKLLLVNGSGERVAHGGDYHFTGEVTAADLVPQAAQWYILPLEGASEAVKVYAWVYEAAFEDGSVLKLNEQ